MHPPPSRAPPRYDERSLVCPFFCDRSLPHDESRRRSCAFLALRGREGRRNKQRTCVSLSASTAIDRNGRVPKWRTGDRRGGQKLAQSRASRLVAWRGRVQEEQRSNVVSKRSRRSTLGVALADTDFWQLLYRSLVAGRADV